MRLLNRLFAALFGYFWLPCPACGRMFGGHEVSLGRAPLIQGGHAWVVCSDACGLIAAERNAEVKDGA